MSWPTPLWNDGDLGTPKRCSLPVLSSPIPGVNTPYILTEDWQQLLVNASAYTPTPLNTAHPEYSGFALVEEGEQTSLGGGMVRWRRTYAKKPSTHSEYESFTYGFPGTVDFTNVAGTTLLPRAQYNQTVTSRVQHDYFLVGTSGAGLVSPDYSDAGLIPRNLAFRVVLDGTFSGSSVGSWYAISPNNLVIKSGGDTVNGLLYPETCPNLANYYAAVKDANTNKWGASVTSQPITVDASTGYAYIVLASCTWGGQLVAEDSRLSRWRGNIWVRKTRYVLAI